MLCYVTYSGRSSAEAFGNAPIPNLDRTPIVLENVSLSNIFATTTQLRDQILSHYKVADELLMNHS